MAAPASSSSSVTARVEAATSPALLEADWALNFEVVDALGDAAAARDAVRALRARLASPNPKVLLLALTVRARVGAPHAAASGSRARARSCSCSRSLARARRSLSGARSRARAD